MYMHVYIEVYISMRWIAYRLDLLLLYMTCIAAFTYVYIHVYIYIGEVHALDT